MIGENLEVFCKNINCGDPDLFGGRRHRRMNYMGSYDLGSGMAILVRLVHNSRARAGVYYLYECPVCGANRAYSYRNGLLIETKRSI